MKAYSSPTLKWIFFFVLSTSFLLVSCGGNLQEFEIDELQEIGVYVEPEYYKSQTIAVIDFEDKTGGERGDAGADEMATLLQKSKRFTVIERERLQEILEEQNLIGVAYSELIPKGKLLGADLLCLGSITNFEVKTTDLTSKGGFLSSLVNIVANVFSPIPVPRIDFDYNKQQLEINIGVDLRIVDTTTSEVMFAESSDVQRIETAKSLGLVILGISTRPDGSVAIDNENQGKLLRMALHQALKKMLVQIDDEYSYN